MELEKNEKHRSVKLHLVSMLSYPYLYIDLFNFVYMSIEEVLWNKTVQYVSLAWAVFLIDSTGCNKQSLTNKSQIINKISTFWIHDLCIWVNRKGRYFFWEWLTWCYVETFIFKWKYILRIWCSLTQSLHFPCNKLCYLI